MVRRLLNDAEWAFFDPFVVERGALRGRPPSNHCRVLDAIFWIGRTGAPRRDLPAELSNWNSVHRHFRRWTASVLWDLMLQALAEGGGGNALQTIDSTIISARHCAAGARGPQNQALARSRALSRLAAMGTLRGGFSTKIHAQTNAEGLPVGLLSTPGQAHDCTAYAGLMDEHDADPRLQNRVGWPSR